MVDGARRGGGTWILLGLRFVLELALLATVVVVAWRAVGGALGLLVGLAAAAAVGAVWGVLLSPRRRVPASLGARVAVEGLLFLAAAAGLALTGLPALGLTLLVAEVVVVGWLWALGLTPGTDLEA